MYPIADRLARLRTQITGLERRYARGAGSVRLVGIAKTHDASVVRQAVDAGLVDIGESYLQEALPKIAELRGLGITWHFVGRVQGNKTADIAAHFDWVHSLDRARIAERLDAQRPGDLPPLQCCLQVRLSDEESKGGVTIEELETLAARVAQLPRLRLRGLMALPAPATGLQAQREPFARLAA